MNYDLYDWRDNEPPEPDYDEPRPRRPFRCADGFCGAEDCARCHPGWKPEDEEEEEEP